MNSLISELHFPLSPVCAAPVQQHWGFGVQQEARLDAKENLLLSYEAFFKSANVVRVYEAVPAEAPAAAKAYKYTSNGHQLLSHFYILYTLGKEYNTIPYLDYVDNVKLKCDRPRRHCYFIFYNIGAPFWGGAILPPFLFYFCSSVFCFCKLKNWQ